MCTKSTMLALAALLLCAACGQQPAAKTKLAENENLQISSIRWDESTAATQSARVNNTGLIMMR